MWIVIKLRKVTQRIYKNIFDAEIQLLAQSMAFMSVLSIVPFLAVSLFTFQFFGGPERFIVFLEPKILEVFKIEGLRFDLSQWQPLLEKFLTQNLSEKLVVFLNDIIKNIDIRSIGLTGFFSLLLTSVKLLADIDLAIQRIWHLKIKRTFTKRISFYFLIILFGPMALSLILGFLSSGTLGIFEITSLSVFRGLTYLLICVFLTIIYKTVPYTKTFLWPSTLSALVTTVSLFLAKSFYFYVMKNLMFYNKVYGSLASIPLFLIWILFIWMIVLSGAVLNATLHEDS